MLKAQNKLQPIMRKNTQMISPFISIGKSADIKRLLLLCYACSFIPTSPELLGLGTHERDQELTPLGGNFMWIGGRSVRRRINKPTPKPKSNTRKMIAATTIIDENPPPPAWLGSGFPGFPPLMPGIFVELGPCVCMPPIEVTVAVAVGNTLAVAVGAEIGCGVGRGVGDGVAYGLEIGDGVSDGVGIGDGVGRGVGMGDGVGRGVGVGVGQRKSTPHALIAYVFLTKTGELNPAIANNKKISVLMLTRKEIRQTRILLLVSISNSF